MRVYIRGNVTSVDLTQSDFVARGGEGTIYRKAGGRGNLLAYKIFHNSNEVPPEAKIDELSVLDKPNIIRPIDLLLDNHKKIVGFNTKWVNGIPLCRMFVTSFRKRENIKNDHIIELIDNIKDTIQHIHSKNIIMVDGNEMNYIVGKDFTTPYFIDTTCYQTPSFPATVIMPSIQDFTRKGFDEMTDWFSFAVIACWMFTGVHPFKGKHDFYDKRFDDISDRMKYRVLGNVSIFNKDVRVARNARMRSIPNHYKQWFIRMFEKGERLYPPMTSGMVIVSVPVSVKVVTGTNNFLIDECMKFDNDVIWFSNINGVNTTKTTEYIRFKKRKIKSDSGTSIIMSPNTNTPIIAKIEGDFLELSEGENFRPQATEIMVIENTLYYRYREKLVEMSMTERFGKIIPSVSRIWNIMPNSSEIFAGVVIENMMGKIHVTMPIPKSSSCITMAIPELDKYKIYDAKHSKGILVVHAKKKGRGQSLYHMLVFRFNKKYSEYDFRTIKCHELGEVNFTVLDNGIGIHIPKNGLLEVFGNRPFVNDVQGIKDSVISRDMKLCKDGVKAMFIKDKKIYTIKMK